MNNKGDDVHIHDTEEIKELFTEMNLFVKDVDINEKENLANVYITVDGTQIYTLGTLERKIDKIKELEQRLTDEGIAQYILIGDLYQGSWKIMVNFN